MKAKRLIEVAMPIKEISAESVHEKNAQGGYISQLHQWWARRPLPTCRAVVFASLVPDPLDDDCAEAFRDAVRAVLHVGKGDAVDLMYRPYSRIPYTARHESMPDNLRNRLLMFIGKFSDTCCKEMIQSGNLSPKGATSCERISEGSLVKLENGTSETVLGRARELLWVAYNSERNAQAAYEALHNEFLRAYKAIRDAENALYEGTCDRHVGTDAVREAERRLQDAIRAFRDRMPSVYDPFAGGGAIPVEAARLGCRSFGGDLNPVAYVVERASAEFPQRYGKPIRMSASEFDRVYGERGRKMAEAKKIRADVEGVYRLPNRLAFDVEYYGGEIIDFARREVSHLYPADAEGRNVIAYYWVRTARCSNPSCGAEVPLLRQFYLAATKKRHVYLKPVIEGTDIRFEIAEGRYDEKEMPGWNNRGRLTCPCCGNVTDEEKVREQSCGEGLGERLIAVISDTKKGSAYTVPTEECKEVLKEVPEVSDAPRGEISEGNANGIRICGWGFKNWGDVFSARQLCTLQAFVRGLDEVKARIGSDGYGQAVVTMLAMWVDKMVNCNTTMGRWEKNAEKAARIFSRQAVSMVYDYPEVNPFSGKTRSAGSMLRGVTGYIEEEGCCPFDAEFSGAMSGDCDRMERKSINATVTDPPYYDAIAYADLSDFYYVWLKRTLGDVYPENFSTPLTPKAEECTALKHHHNNSQAEADSHFEGTLTRILSAIERQTEGVVCVMFAHKKTEAWTTLCNAVINSGMNITGSWAIDTEMSGRMRAVEGNALESSVTVACRPTARRGIGDYGELKARIRRRVEEEAKKLYELGLRGADLQTACFGVATGEFGGYERIERSDGTEVGVGELLGLARDVAKGVLNKQISDDPYTNFYIGWLRENGMGERKYDELNKQVRVEGELEIKDVEEERLVVTTRKKVRLATAHEHLDGRANEGYSAEDAPISQAHRAILLNEREDRDELLRLVGEVAPRDGDKLWRTLEALKEYLPSTSDDWKQVNNLLQNAATLRRDSKRSGKNKGETAGTLGF